MKKLYLLLIIAVASVNLNAQSFLSYYSLSNYQQASPSAFKFGLYGFDNPAGATYLHDADLMFLMSDRTNQFDKFSDWGIFSSSPYTNFGMLAHKENGRQVIDYRYSIALGDNKFSIGLGYGWVGGDKSYFKRSNSYQLGFLYRPFSWISASAHMNAAIDNDDAEYVAELAVRPIPTYPLAFFGDYGYLDFGGVKVENWSAGASWEIIDGVRINGRYFKDKSVNIGFDLSFGTTGVSSVTSNATKENNAGISNTFAIRMGAIDRTIFDDVFKSIIPSKFWYKMDLSGTIKYQNGMFDESGNTLLGIIEKIDNLMKDPMVAGIVINATTTSGNKSIMWEVREKLKEFKATGKKVYIFIERSGLDEYYFASIADKIYMEPLGGMSLEGYATGRSYYKSMLEKVGVGFDELRFLKYKSAYENFSNEKMTEGDREQRQKLINDWYEIVKRGITESRKISAEDFDKLVNGQMSYRTKEAIEKKLVDVEGRWVEVEKIMKEEKDFAGLIDAKFINSRPMPYDDKWAGASSKIAIVYAIGECSMNSGINARKLVNDIKAVAEDDNVKAIVLRVDSPGGDALASDYIAEVVRKFKSKKPIIVTQGAVAASGGYWLSMDATKIISTPMTVTGSIGVISGWFYDKGLSEKLGITTDLVKVGKYSDLGYPFQLPFIGIGLPARPFTAEERKEQETSILKFYDDFTQMVADGRKMKKEDVHTVAQGRVWTGEAAKPLGLVDELGGMSLAIKEAKKAANLTDKDNVDFVEYPRPTFDFGSLIIEMVTGVNLKNIAKIDSKLNNVKFMMENNGKALHMLPMDYLDLVPDYNK